MISNELRIGIARTTREVQELIARLGGPGAPITCVTVDGRVHYGSLAVGYTATQGPYCLDIDGRRWCGAIDAEGQP